MSTNKFNDDGKLNNGCELGCPTVANGICDTCSDKDTCTAYKGDEAGGLKGVPFSDSIVEVLCDMILLKKILHHWKMMHCLIPTTDLIQMMLPNPKRIF